MDESEPVAHPFESVILELTARLMELDVIEHVPLEELEVVSDDG